MAENRLYTQASGNKTEYEDERSVSQHKGDYSVKRLRPRIFIILLFISLITGAPLILGRLLSGQKYFVLVLLLFVVLTVLSIILSGIFAQPVTRITKLADRIATGDLYVQIPESEDELSILVHALNRMTAELRKTLVGMEQTIAQRTSELARASEQMQKRAVQLQSVAEVAHAIASIQDPDFLLKQVTELISKNFGLYHVGIFLIDKNREFDILQAANSEGGQKMLARGHRLRVGEEGIVGYASEKGIPRVAADVGDDAVYFNNPDLPYTKSEAAIPLRVGERVIGVLDVQSMEMSAFKEEDIAVLTTLADQVAIAIENARLFRETRNALAELETLHRQYLRQAWADQASERRSGGYAYTDGRLSPIPCGAADDIWQDNETRESTSAAPEDEEASPGTMGDSATLIMPVTVHGQTIGVFKLETPEDPRRWDKDVINLVKTIADQVGLAIENARLFAETQRRAERERMVSEITAKLRASNDPQIILQTAAEELRQALHAKRTQVVVQSTEGIETLSSDNSSALPLQENSLSHQREQQGDGK